MINLWLIQLDRAISEKNLSKCVFEDVRMFNEFWFKNDHTDFSKDPLLFQIKPRVKKLLLDTIFETKY